MSRIYIAGHRGLAGSAIVRGLQRAGFCDLLLRTHAELDLTDQAAVRAFFQKEQPEHVVLAAAKVGGILANNSFPAEFVGENLAIQTNVMHEAWRTGVKRLIFLGSSCMYPRDAAQPIREDSILTGPVEPTNRAFAVAKLAGVEMCRSYNRQYGCGFLTVTPPNLYGPGDNYDLQTSHVLPALIRKAHEARLRGEATLAVWGSGNPRRELLYSDDMAAACLLLLGLPEERYRRLVAPDALPVINIGTGTDVTVRDLAKTVTGVVSFAGELVFDESKPDGAPQKLLDISRIHALGWQAATSLAQGVRHAYEDFLAACRGVKM